MLRRSLFCLAFLSVCAGALAADLATSPSEKLLQVYAQLRSLKGSPQGAIAENVKFRRDAATFTFEEGRLTLAAPVEARILAAVFRGRGTFELAPPSPVDQRQIARYAKAPRLVDKFREAVFFFTDDSYGELQKLLNIRPDADATAATADLQSAQKEYAENFNDWIDNERKVGLVMRNLAARMLADLTDPSSHGFFLAGFKGENSGDLLFHISWNRDPVLMPEINNAEEVVLVHVNRGSYFEWWAGFHLADEYAKSPHPDHRTLLAHCSSEAIDAEVSNDNHLSATASLEFETPGGTPRVLPFTLRGVLRIRSIEGVGGKKIEFIQEDRKLDNDPWMILPEPAKAGETYEVKIAYEEDSTRDSRIIHQRGPGLYYVTARESWFPSFGAFDDRVQFAMHFRSPKKFKFIGTGSLVQSEKEKDFVVTQWKSEIPLSVVGFNYGDFVDHSQSGPTLTVTAYTGREIPDELRQIQAAIDAEQLRRGSGAGDLESKLGIMSGGFNTATGVKYAAGVSFQALRLYEYWFGPLPFKAVSVTEQPVTGYGQSWPTLIFLPYDSLLDSTTRNSLRLQESAEAREFYNVVAVHEMAHQWWGHLVGWKTYRDQWLSEGFAEFSASLYLRQFEPKKVAGFWELKRRSLFSKDRAGHRPVDVGALSLGAQLPSYLEPELYQDLVYYKGAYVLEMLRALMWDPRSQNPEARFISMMRDFVTTYAGKNASTEDFRRVVEKHMGEPMDWFFNEWVYGTEIPHYEFSYDLKDVPGGKTELSMSTTQSGVSDSFVMRVPVDVYLNGQSRRLGMVNIKGRGSTRATVQLPFRPEKVVLDDAHSILRQ
jgi:hypothetical protein